MESAIVDQRVGYVEPGTLDLAAQLQFQVDVNLLLGRVARVRAGEETIALDIAFKFGMNAGQFVDWLVLRRADEMTATEVPAQAPYSVERAG